MNLTDQAFDHMETRTAELLIHDNRRIKENKGFPNEFKQVSPFNNSPTGEPCSSNANSTIGRCMQKTNDSPESSRGERKDSLKKKILDIIGIYDNNPSLQKIRKKPMRRKLKSNRDSGRTLKAPLPQRTTRLKRKYHSSIPLPPTAAMLSEKKRVTRRALKKRVNLEKTIQKNVEKIQKSPSSTEEHMKRAESKNRYDKSEFDVMSKLRQLKISNENSETNLMPLTTLTVDSKYANEGSIISKHSSNQERVFKAVRFEVDVKRTEDKTCRTDRIRKLYRTINQSRLKHETPLTPLDASHMTVAAEIIVEVESDED